MNVHEMREASERWFQREYWRWAEHTCDFDWWDGVEWSFKQDMESLGVEVERVYFALSYSQGDYAAFTGYVDVRQWLEANHPDQLVLIQEFGDYGRLKVSERRGSTRVDFDWYPGNTYPSGIFADLPVEEWTALVEQASDDFDVESELNDWLGDMADGLYRQLQAEYEYQTSEEQFIEYCECNEIEFFDDETEE